MNSQEYVDMKTANTINEESWEALWRKLAFVEFDAALEEFVENDKKHWAENNGRSLMGASPAEVESILDAFLDRVEDRIRWLCAEEMRNAIQAVTGLVS